MVISGYLYFPNNLKYIKDHMPAYMIINNKIFFSAKSNIFNKSMKKSTGWELFYSAGLTF